MTYYGGFNLFFNRSSRSLLSARGNESVGFHTLMYHGQIMDLDSERIKLATVGTVTGWLAGDWRLMTS
jgi:hypothetical protein